MFPGGIGASLPCDGKDIEPAIKDVMQSLFLAYKEVYEMVTEIWL